jgi:hypothetical protein
VCLLCPGASFCSREYVCKDSGWRGDALQATSPCRPLGWSITVTDRGGAVTAYTYDSAGEFTVGAHMIRGLPDEPYRCILT